MSCDYKKIALDNIRRRGEEFDDIGRLISEELYSDKSHFIYELLQNAEDALARRFKSYPYDSSPRKVHFKLFKDRLEFRHFGALFNEDDVKGITDVLKGTKRDDLVQIGKFGIGFKSVYAFTASPEIHSGDEHFIIKRYIRPEFKTPDITIGQNETVFIFPFDHKVFDAELTFELIKNKLLRLGPRVLLFLKWIEEIEWESKDGNGIYLKESIDVKKIKNARRINVLGQNNGEDENETWLIFDRTVKFRNPSNNYVSSIPVEIGFLLGKNEKTKKEHIIKINKSPLVAFFPTEKETYLGFLIQGPFKTTPSRDNILRDDNLNLTLIKETAVLVVDSLSYLKDLGLLNVNLLEALPLRITDYLFSPIFNAVRDAFINMDLLPTDDKHFVSAKNAKLASADWLRKLLKKEQLLQLFKIDTPINWITGEITDTRYDLWKYMRDELKIEEITPDSFVRKVDINFFEKQSDEWFIEFYKQLQGQKSLWKKSKYYSDRGPLQYKPFIRLQNGQHVQPLYPGSTPNAYLSSAIINDPSLPIIKLTLIANEDIKRFLLECGIPEYDIVAEVIEHIIPKYSPSMLNVDNEEHKKDIEKIVIAYKTDSQEKKQRLIKALQETSFVLTESPDYYYRNVYRKPRNVYFPNEILRTYFAGNTHMGFINSIYDESLISFFRELGVADSIRISKNHKDNNGNIIIREYHSNHVRGLYGFDSEIKVDGLQHAMTSPSVEKSSYIWNHIAISNIDCIKGLIETSTRQTFEGCETRYIVSEFGSLLIEGRWLPGPDGEFHKPCELRLDELPAQYERNEKLAELLGMRKDEVGKLAELIGLKRETLELAKILEQYPEILEYAQQKFSEINKKPTFPERTVVNKEQREEKITDQLNDSPGKTFEKRVRSVRTTKGTIDPSIWLREQYTNEEGQMVCQICKQEMPFKKRNGDFYFEAVEAFSSDYFSKEFESQFLALCPICAAMYKEFIKNVGGDKDREELIMNLQNNESLEIPLRLGEFQTTIKFVETHSQDIRTILRKALAT